jgi:hypothetical protein
MIKRKLKYGLFLFVLGVTTISSGQKQKAMNLRDFDNHDFHFGFLLAYNSSDFFMEIKPDYTFSDSIVSIQNFRQPGFNLGIISSWNMNKNMSLRFLPDLSFQDRVLEYNFQINDTTFKLEKRRVESTFFNFPLNLKLRTNRINNFAMYMIGGYQFGIDMASQKDVNNAGNNSIVKIKRIDHALQIGGGIDFFLPYFKFGIELKLSKGMKNLLIQDGTKFVSPLDALRSKMWILSFTFEG